MQEMQLEMICSESEIKEHKDDGRGLNSHSVVQLHLQQVCVVGFILALFAVCWSRIGRLRLHHQLHTQ